MRRNKLYTVNKWNKPAFMGDREHQNIFDDYLNSKLTPQQMANLKAFNLSANMTPSLGTSSLGTLGNVGGVGSLSEKDPTKFFGLNGGTDGASKGFLSGTGKAIGSAALSAGAGLLGGLASNAISGGLQSGAGSAISNIGGTIGGAIGTVNPVAGAIVGVGSQLLGGIANRAFGSKLNEENIAEVQNKANALTEQGNAIAGAQTNEDVLNNWGKTDLSFNFGKDFIGEDGWFSNEAEEKYQELKRQMDFAKKAAVHGLSVGIQNADTNLDDNVLANYAGFGGKLFADGGLQAAFMDEFGSDPVGAAMRYKQGLERQAAEEEEAAMNAAREAEYLANQQRLANLETQYQGLQALMSAMPTQNYSEETLESSSPSRATSKASGNKTWDYIEDQLKKSGKFNDTQIKGIKYNLQRESSINPDIVGDEGAAFGLAQWHGSRQPKDKSLEGQTKHLIETLSNFDGKEHWVGRENYEGFLNARTPEEAHYYIAKGYERPHKDIVAKVKRDSDMSLRNLRAFGGELGTNGTDFTDGMIYIDEGGSHEENPLDGVPMGIDAEGIPNLVEEGETVYNDYVFSDRMKVPTFMYKELGLGGVIKKKGKGMSFADASKKLSQESEQRPNDPISKAGLDAALSRLAEVQETERMKQNAEEYNGLAEYACGGKLGKKFAGPGNKSQFKSSNNPYGDDVDDFVPVTEEEGRLADAMMADDNEWLLDPYTEGWEERRGISTTPDTRTTGENAEENYNPYPTWMRYAPAFGNGVMALTDALGITNTPDYTYADKLEGYARQAGIAPHVGYKPIGNYLRYNPMDIWFEQNRMDTNARATDRAIINNAAPIGTKMAGLLASGYNNQIANGQLYRSALEYNDAKRKDVAGFNRTTDMFNSQMGLEAAMANARYQQAAKQMGLSGLAQAASMRDAIDQRVGAARSANLTNFLTSLGNIGRENFALNQINSDRSRQYGVDRSGSSKHKRSSKGKSGSRWT